MPQLGRKYNCYSCHTKFYDLGKPEPICPKCGADQRDADDAPVVTSSRGRRAAPPPVVEPVEEPEFGVEAEAEDAEVEEEILDEREEVIEEEEEEEEY